MPQYGYDRDTFPAADYIINNDGTIFDKAVANGTYTGISLPSLLTSRYDGETTLQSGPTIVSELPEAVRTGAIHSNTFLSSITDDIYGMDVYEDFAGEMDNDDAAPTTNRATRQLFDLVRPKLKRMGIFGLARRIQQAVFPASLIHEVTVFKSAKTTTDRAIEFIKNTDGSFCLWVHYMDPHRPYAINAGSPAYAPDLDESEIFDLMANAGIEPEKIDHDQRELLIDLYDSAIKYTSKHISRLFDELMTEGLWDNTSIILTADHGEEFGEHGLYFHRNRPYDELARVPMMMKPPNNSSNLSSRITEQRELLDVAPTVCRLHGVDPPENFLGTDLRDSTTREPITRGSFTDDVPVVAVRSDGWKYIDIGGNSELYDLDTDPGEQNDVSGSNPDKLGVYRSKIPDRLFNEGDSGVPEEVTDDARQRLAELGYLD